MPYVRLVIHLCHLHVFLLFFGSLSLHVLHRLCPRLVHASMWQDDFFTPSPPAPSLPFSQTLILLCGHQQCDAFICMQCTPMMWNYSDIYAYDTPSATSILEYNFQHTIDEPFPHVHALPYLLLCNPPLTPHVGISYYRQAVVAIHSVTKQLVQ